MQEFALIARIQELCNARGWTYYPLAKERGITYRSVEQINENDKIAVERYIAFLLHEQAEKN